MDRPGGPVERLSIRFRSGGTSRSSTSLISNADGRLDLVGLSAKAARLGVSGGAPRTTTGRSSGLGARRVFGDGRINSFGLGGEIEVRAGLLVQKQVDHGPIIHFGLGDRPRSDVARIVWPNGTSQVEFDAKADQELSPNSGSKALARSSLPSTARCASSPISSGDRRWAFASTPRTRPERVRREDWVKIRGDQLAPRDRCVRRSDHAPSSGRPTTSTTSR